MRPCEAVLRHDTPFSARGSATVTAHRVLRIFIPRSVFWAAVFLAALPLTARAAFSEPAPVARIIYTADTLGYVHPCTTCGGSSQGGLARRVALLPKLAAETARPLVLAGPGEFYTDRAEVEPDKAERLTPIFHAAFSAMPYTAVYLSENSSAALKKASLPDLPNAVPLGNMPVTRSFRAGTLTVGCVFLPSGKKEDGGPDPEQVLAAQQAAREASSAADLVVAVSPWGIYAENSLMPSLAGYFHIVLGGGRGIAVPGQATGDPGSPGPLWARSDRRGRAINVLDIYALPLANSPWLEGVHFSSRLVFLDPSLPEEPAIRSLVDKLGNGFE